MSKVARQDGKRMIALMNACGVTADELNETIKKYRPIVDELGILKDADMHQETYFYARLCLQDRKWKSPDSDWRSAMSFRDFFRITQLAKCGKSVAVYRFDERDARRVLIEYMDNLKMYGVKGWNARMTNGNNIVRFDSGGWVLFMSSSRQLRGVDIIYDTDDDISKYLR